MTYKATIEIESEKLNRYKKWFSYGETNMIADDIPPMQNIITFTAHFENGVEADIKINSSEDDIWSEGVLFSHYGYELANTEVCDSIEGLWEFDYNGDKYEVNIVAK